jgi:hypothetical protein
LPFDLTLDDVERLMQPMTCSVTGLSLRTKWDGPGTNPFAPSLDQIAPGAGYTVRNLRVVAWAYNAMRAALEDSMVARFAAALVQGDVVPDPVNGERLLSSRSPHGGPFAGHKLQNWRASAKKRNLGFQISREWVDAQLATGVCSVTGLPFSIENVGHNRMNPLMPSLDRIDCTKDYAEDNARLVCCWYNLARKQWNDDVPLTVARALVSKGR